MKKKMILALTMVLTLTTALGAMTFADDSTPVNENGGFERKIKMEVSEEVKARVEALKEEGKTREEIHEILVSEGLIQERSFTFASNVAKLAEGRVGKVKATINKVSEEVKARVEVLKEEGLTREEIHETLIAEGLVEERAVAKGDHVKLEEVKQFMDGEIDEVALRAALEGKVDDVDQMLTHLLEMKEVRAYVETIKADFSREDVKTMLEEKFPNFTFKHKK